MLTAWTVVNRAVMPWRRLCDELGRFTCQCTNCLPKGEVILVPFFIDAFIGEPLHWAGGRQLFMDALAERMHELQEKAVVIDDFL